MKSKAGLVVLIILVIIVVAIAAVIAAGGISIGGGNKVTVMGTVYYDMFTGWGVTYDDHLVEEDGIFAVLWYFPWETKDIEVVVELSDEETTYSASSWVGRLSSIVGSTGFSVDVRHVPAGEYMGKIYVYEVEKEFIFGERSRVLQATTSFGVTV